MTTETTLEGLRAQIIANWKALGRDPGGELVTVMDERKHWQAFIVQDLKAIEPLRNWYDTKEEAMEHLLESLSWQLFNELEGQNI